MKVASTGSDAPTEKRRSSSGWFAVVVGHKLIKL